MVDRQDTDGSPGGVALMTPTRSCWPAGRQRRRGPQPTQRVCCRVVGWLARGPRAEGFRDCLLELFILCWRPNC